ncbi:hypothetical protein ACFVAF_25445 [Streptomyces sp. NPDC057596]|uniref:hypothetical protein n=1 Tax=Streptomyces sp. NPDC057596 TaxID=3346178 RepID=UPI0036ACF5FB
MEDIDVTLSAELDRPGELRPMLTQGEARAARYALHLFGQGDGPGSQAARDLEVRLERRLEVMFPGEGIHFAEELPQVPV